MATALCSSQGIGIKQNIIQPSPQPLWFWQHINLLLSGQAFHLSDIISVLLSLFF